MKQRFLKSHGVTHLMRQHSYWTWCGAPVWISLCDQEARRSQRFPWGHRPPADCMTCLVVAGELGDALPCWPTEVPESWLDETMDYRKQFVTPLLPPLPRDHRPYGVLRDALSSALLYKDAVEAELRSFERAHEVLLRGGAEGPEFRSLMYGIPW